MYVYKVRQCYRSYPHNWSTCPYVHPGEKARRRDPRIHSYRPLPCPHDRQGSVCPDGDACSYTHNVYEAWLHPSRFRTQKCQDGEACNRALCFFAHNAQQLRNPEPAQGQPLAGPSSGSSSAAGLLPLPSAGPGPAAKASMLPPGMTLLDAARMFVDTGDGAAAQTAPGTAPAPAAAAAEESLHPDVLAVLSQFRQRHAMASAAAAAGMTTSALDNAVAETSANAAAAVAAEPAGIAEAAYEDDSTGAAGRPLVLFPAGLAGAAVLQQQGAGSTDAAGSQQGAAHVQLQLQQQLQQQPAWMSGPLQQLQLAQAQQQQQQEDVSAPMLGIGYFLLPSPRQQLNPGPVPTYTAMPPPALPAPAQSSGQLLTQQQLSQLAFLGAGAAEMPSAWPQQQRQQQHAQGQPLLQQQYVQMQPHFQQQREQHQAAGPLQVVSMAMAGSAGLQPCLSAPAHGAAGSQLLLGSVATADGGSMPVFGNMHALSPQPHPAPSRPVASRSAPLFQLP